MGRAVRILLGQQFGRLRVVERARNRAGIVYWWCECYCGRSLSVRATSLANGSTRSCGCLHAESARQRGRERATGQAQANRLAGALNGSAKTARTLRIANALADVFGKPVDTAHVDRSGARVIRGGRY